MNQQKALELAIKTMRSRNYCEIKQSQIICQIKQKEEWELSELSQLIFGKNKQFYNYLNSYAIGLKYAANQQE